MSFRCFGSWMVLVEILIFVRCITVFWGLETNVMCIASQVFETDRPNVLWPEERENKKKDFKGNYEVHRMDLYAQYILLCHLKFTSIWIASMWLGSIDSFSAYPSILLTKIATLFQMQHKRVCARAISSAFSSCGLNMGAFRPIAFGYTHMCLWWRCFQWNFHNSIN